MPSCPDVLVDGADGALGRLLVELPSECGPVEAVNPEEPRILSERAERETGQEGGEVRLRSIEVPVAIITESPIIEYCILPGGSAGQWRQ